MNSKIKTISRNALGRSHNLGEIYDTIEERFVGVHAFTESVEKFSSEMNCGGDECSFVLDDIMSQKFDKLGIEPELKLSFLAGLVKVQGSGKYLEEFKKDTKTLSYSVIFKIRTKSEILNILNQMFYLLTLKMN